MSEFTHIIKARQLPGDTVQLEAGEAQRAALARRFGVTGIDRLDAQVAFAPKDDAIMARGTFDATIRQPCAVTGDPLSYDVHDDFTLRFVAEDKLGEYEEDTEFELTEDDLDEIEYDGETIDIGEAIAQELGLAIDPYREGEGADAARAETGIESDEEREVSGPLAEALLALKKD